MNTTQYPAPARPERRNGAQLRETTARQAAKPSASMRDTPRRKSKAAPEAANGEDMATSTKTLNTNPKVYKGERLNPRLRSMHASFLIFLNFYNWRHSRRRKAVSADYQHTRYCILASMLLEDLPALGYEPTRLEQLKPKHTKALIKSWIDAGLSARTIQNRLTVLRWVCRILKKRECIPDNLEGLVDDPVRLKISTVAREENTFSAKGIDPVAVIQRIAEHDPRVALIQLLKATFGLRNKEAIRLKPHEACHGDYLLVTLGTK